MTTEVVVSRCRDAQTIERFLTHEYYDLPVSLFTRRMLRAAARWLATLDASYFIVADVGGQPAGYVFATTLGRDLWTTFARRHPMLAPDVLWTWARVRFLRRWKFGERDLSHAAPQSDPARVSGLEVPGTDAPFEWSEPDSRTGYIELLYVSRMFRGHNIAPLMLRAMVREMSGHGVRRVEAHIDATNYASVRAFGKAGWTVVRTSGRDFSTYIACSEPQRES